MATLGELACRSAAILGDAFCSLATTPWPLGPSLVPRRQLLVYPTGNNRQDALALYLAVAEDDQAAFQLNRSAHFKLMLLSEVAGGDVVKETQHVFTHRETDWGASAVACLACSMHTACLRLHRPLPLHPAGFTAFIPLVELHDPARALVVDDTIHVKVCPGALMQALSGVVALWRCRRQACHCSPGCKPPCFQSLGTTVCMSSCGARVHAWFCTPASCF